MWLKLLYLAATNRKISSGISRVKSDSLILEVIFETIVLQKIPAYLLE